MPLLDLLEVPYPPRRRRPPHRRRKHPADAPAARLRRVGDEVPIQDGELLFGVRAPRTIQAEHAAPRAAKRPVECLVVEDHDLPRSNQPRRGSRAGVAQEQVDGICCRQLERLLKMREAGESRGSCGHSRRPGRSPAQQRPAGRSARHQSSLQCFGRGSCAGRRRPSRGRRSGGCLANRLQTISSTIRRGQAGPLRRWQVQIPGTTERHPVSFDSGSR